MTIEAWLVLALSAIVVPCVTWLIREVLAMRLRIVAIETKVELMQVNCLRHQEWQEGLSRAVGRTAVNVARLCENSGVPYVGD